MLTDYELLKQLVKNLYFKTADLYTLLEVSNNQAEEGAIVVQLELPMLRKTLHQLQEVALSIKPLNRNKE